MCYLTCRNRHPPWSWSPTGGESCNQMKNLPLVPVKLHGIGVSPSSPPHGCLGNPSSVSRKLFALFLVLVVRILWAWLLAKSWLPVHWCPPSESMDTEFGFLPGKREMQQASASRTVPHFLRNREGFYILLKVLLFCFSPADFQNSHSWLRQLSSQVWCPWSYQPMTFFLKCRMLQESVGGEEGQVLSIISMESESN